MKRSALLAMVGLLVISFSVQRANAGPIVYTMSVTENGTTQFGDPQGVGGLQVNGLSVNYAKTIDALTPVLGAAAIAGTLLDVIELVGFDGAVSPAAMVGTYRFTDVLVTSVALNQTTEVGSFDSRTATFTQVPEPGTLSLLLLGALPLARRAFCRARESRATGK